MPHRVIAHRAIAPFLSAAALTLLLGTYIPTPWANHSSVIAQAQSQQTNMTLAQLENILQQAASDIEGGNGRWQLTVDGRPVVVLADQNSNRMRIFAPIMATSEVSGEQVQNMLIANFHTALDARYAVSDGTVVSLFVHPLASLTERDLKSALTQVATAANNFGTTYSSGETGFGIDNPQSPQGERLSI